MSDEPLTRSPDQDPLEEGTTHGNGNTTVLPSSLAVRLRAARIATNQTQQQLADGRYSKSYISAVERGKMTPSLQALQLLGARLGLPISFFLGEGAVDLVDLGTEAARSAGLRASPEQERQLRQEAALLTLAQAEGELRLGQPATALALLGVPGEPPPELPSWERPRWYVLAGWALTAEEAYHDARLLLEGGLFQAEGLRLRTSISHQVQLAEQTEWLRYYLGISWAAEGQVDAAFALHRQCQAAIEEERVHDPALVLAVAGALAAHYLQRECWQEAASLLSQVLACLGEGELSIQAQRSWKLGCSSQAAGENWQAQRGYTQAITLLGIHESRLLADQVRLRLGEALLHLERDDEAEPLFEQTLQRAQPGNPAIQGAALAGKARLYLRRGAYHQAIETVCEGFQLPALERSTSGTLYLILADAYRTSNKEDAAEAAFQQAIRILEPLRESRLKQEASERFGRFLADQGRFEEAYVQLQALQPRITPGG